MKSLSDYQELTITINGEPKPVHARPSDTLLETLRDQLGLMGTRRGCDSGACGACTVLLDNQPVLSCLTLTVRCAGRRVVTIEGLASHGKLDALQEAAITHDSVQCGFCTPGWIMSAKALLLTNPRPTRQEVKRAIGGNLCRCGGYSRIEDAILDAAGRQNEQPEST
jgi:aerobic-type carbon monoxide dehydrogenase small subunit (CoxS/CutS family)